MEYKLKTGPQGHVYFPKRIRENFGEKMRFLPNTHAAVLYSDGADPKDVIASLQVIISDLKLRIKKEAEKP
jgi:hypothetical protein